MLFGCFAVHKPGGEAVDENTFSGAPAKGGAAGVGKSCPFKSPVGMELLFDLLNNGRGHDG